MQESTVDSNINILKSIFLQKSQPQCRMYHCYRECGDLFCKSVPHSTIPLHAPYTDIFCVKETIPKMADPIILKYKCIPTNVYIDRN